MRMVIITTAYPLYLKKFYDKNPGLETKKYYEQKKILDYDSFGWPDFWENALRPLGYEVNEYLTNADPLQKMWAKENGLLYNDNNWFLEITEGQILKDKPDILFIVDYARFSYTWIKELLEKCPSIKLVLGWCGAPYQDETVFKAYDIVLSCIPELVDNFSQKGHKSYHINHAFDERILNKIDLNSELNIDFSFTGQIYRDNEFHIEREKILEALVSQVDVKIFTPSAEQGVKENFKYLVRKGNYYSVALSKKLGIPETLIKKIPLLKRAALWRNVPLKPVNSKLKKYMHSPVFGLDMFQMLRNSKVTFNSHINISPRSASNMRLFEATGVGTCLLTDWKENIGEIFEPEKEVVTYKNPEECIERVKWLLEHPKERKAIAKAGQERVLRDHTFKKRAILLDQIIKQGLRK